MKTLASILFLFFNFSLALACTCVNTLNISDTQNSKYLKNVKAIFYGEVVSIEEKRTIEQTSNKSLAKNRFVFLINLVKVF